MSDMLYAIPENVLKDAKNDEISMIKKRVKKRKDEIIRFAKIAAIEYNTEYGDIFEFVISEQLSDEITNNICDVLLKWRGGRGYKKPITSYKEGHKKTRTYWNREKPIPLGDHLFTMVLAVLYEYVMNEFEAGIAIKEKLLLFIHIFEKLLKETIKYEKSMRRPLILYACFFKSNKFKAFCESFVKMFDFEWKNTVQVTKSVKDKNGRSISQYVRNDQRSKQLHDSFINILMNIKTNISNLENIPIHLQEKLNLFSITIGILSPQSPEISYSNSNNNNNNNHNNHDSDNYQCCCNYNQINSNLYNSNDPFMTEHRPVLSVNLSQPNIEMKEPTNYNYPTSSMQTFPFSAVNNITAEECGQHSTDSTPSITPLLNAINSNDTNEQYSTHSSDTSSSPHSSDTQQIMHQSHFNEVRTMNNNYSSINLNRYQQSRMGQMQNNNNNNYQYPLITAPLMPTRRRMTAIPPAIQQHIAEFDGTNQYRRNNSHYNNDYNNSFQNESMMNGYHSFHGPTGERVQELRYNPINQYNQSYNQYNGYNQYNEYNQYSQYQ